MLTANSIRAISLPKLLPTIKPILRAGSATEFLQKKTRVFGKKLILKTCEFTLSPRISLSTKSIAGSLSGVD